MVVHTITVQQDTLYLQTCARLKMMAVAAAPDFDDVEAFEIRHKSSLEYVTSSKEICITMLGIPETAIKTTPRSVELDAIDDHYKASLRTEDALLAFVSICF
jgi:thiaminase